MSGIGRRRDEITGETSQAVEPTTQGSERSSGRSCGVEPTLAGTPGPSVDERPLVQGDVVGRYVTLGRLGAGAMGVVHLAYDPELDRRVALKLLRSRPPRFGDSAGAERTRLLREAQAMAKLSHPNVVTVHDVGEHEGRVFLAMEFVEGCTLEAWLARKSRPWRGVVDVLRQAGLGLAAAHRAGLVHRDFKPDNVMVALVDDRVERVVVMDLGLARPDHDTSETSSESIEISSPKIAALASELTADGAIVGTPAYMPIEQISGRRVDARSDQFAFCVTLFEALYGRRPFAASDLAGLAYAIVGGKLEPPPAGTRVPRWIHRALERGLRSEPRDRFESMEQLLAALHRTPGRRMRTWLAAGIVVAIAAGAWGLLQLWDRRVRAQCRAEGEVITSVWNDGRANAIAEAFSRLDQPWAAAAWQRNAERLDAYAERWSDARERVCLDARVHGTTTDETERIAAGCLEGRLDQVSALLEQLAEPDAVIAAGSVRSVGALSIVGPCLDYAWVARWHTDGAAEPGAARLRRERQRVAVTRVLSQPAKTRAAAQAVYDEAEALGLHGVAVQAQLDAADAARDLPDHATAEREMWGAYLEAVRLGRDDIALRAVTSLVYVVGYLEARPDEGMRSAELANALIQRLSLEGSLEEASLLNALAAVHMVAGRFGEARRAIERTLDIRRRTLGEDHPDVMTALGVLASVFSAQGAEDEALAAHLQALETARETFGPDHPTNITRLNNLAGLYSRYGKHAQAQSHVEQALEQYRRSGRDISDLAAIVYNFGTIALHAGRLEHALEYLRQSLAIYRSVAPRSAHVAEVLVNLGVVHGNLGDAEAAMAHYREALTAFEASFGREHRRTAAAMVNMGSGLIQLGRYEEAREMLEQAVELALRLESTEEVAGVALTNLTELYARDGDHARARQVAQEALQLKEQALGPDHPRVALSLLSLVRQLRALGEDEDVRAHLERALTILEANGAPRVRGEVRFELARVLDERDPQRAHHLAEQARDDLEAAGKHPGGTHTPADVDAWLARHRP